MTWDKGLVRKRNMEICLMFKAVEKLRLREGKSAEESKQEAYDAIELRFGLARTRVRHIVCEYVKKDCTVNLPSIIQDNLSLIKILKEVTDDYKS